MQLFECANNDGYRYGEDDSIGRFNLFVFFCVQLITTTVLAVT